MKINKLRKAMAPFLLTASIAASAQMVDEAGVGGNPGNTTFGSTVLYDQTGATPFGNGAPAQNFEAAYDAYDSAIADDFVVTDAEGWNINSVTLITTTGGAANSVAVSFHADAGGSPNPTPEAGCDFPAATIDSDVGPGTMTVNLGGGCNLQPGTYWMAVSVDQTFATSGQRFVSNTQVIAGSEGHWINPGDGFGSGCTTFQPAGSVCGVGGGVIQDYLFAISGGVIVPPRPVPTASWYGLALLFLGMGFFGRRFLKNS